MDYRKLGASGIAVSPVCLGTMMFGGETDEGESGRIIAAARHAGVNIIDTADVYNDGRSEEVVGRAIAANRDEWVLATKLGNRMGEGPNRAGLSRLWMFQAVDGSLRRLKTDRIDILYLHREDLTTPLPVTVAAMGDLIASGKVRHFGLSNFRAWRVAEVCALCDRLGVPRPVVSQPYYNAMNRMPEVEHLPACGFYGLGVIAYSPLARGVLTGKYAPDAPPPEGTRAARHDKRIMESEWRPESLRIAQTLKRHAEARGTTPIAFAVAWVLHNALVTSTIAGPRTLAQFEGYLAALDYRFTAEDEALVNSLVPIGHPSSPGYNDPAYPLEGRPVRED